MLFCDTTDIHCIMFFYDIRHESFLAFIGDLLGVELGLGGTAGGACRC